MIVINDGDLTHSDPECILALGNKGPRAYFALAKEDSNLEISLEALASQKPMLWAMKKLH